MQTVITLTIERLHEQGQDYYVATSDDLQGLVAQGDTLDEVTEVATDLARILLELERDERD